MRKASESSGTPSLLCPYSEERRSPLRGRLKILQPNHCCPVAGQGSMQEDTKQEDKKLLFLPEPRIVSQKACSGERTANRKRDYKALTI